jgi:hypothetical protein
MLHGTPLTPYSTTDFTLLGVVMAT